MNGDVVRIHSATPTPVRRQVIGPRSGACRLAKCNVELLLKAHGTCNGFFQRQRFTWRNLCIHLQGNLSANPVLKKQT